MKKHKTSILVVLFFTLITFLTFWPSFLKGQFPFPGNFMLAWYEPWKSDFFANNAITIAHKPVADDVFRQIYPFKILASDLLKQLQLPLWNPYGGSGMPLLATMHIGFLNPMNILFVIFQAPIAWFLYIFFQPVLLLFFTYLFTRKIGLSVESSIISGCVFLFSGFVISRLLFGEYIYVFSLLPCLLYLIESLIENQRRKVLLLFPLSVFLLFVSGQPQIIAYVLVFTLLYSIFRIRNVKQQKRISTTLLLLFLLGFGMASVQLFPTAELFLNASINPQSSQFIFDKFRLPIQHLLTILIPNYFGNQATYNYWGSVDYIETAAAIGILPCFLAYLCIFKKNRTKSFFLLGIVASILLAIDWPGSRIIYSLRLPLLSTGVPTRIFGLTSFCLAILAGLGTDTIRSYAKDLKNFYKVTFPFFLFISLLLIGTFIYYKWGISCNNKFITDCRAIAFRNTLLEYTFFVIFLIIFIFSARNKFGNKIYHVILIVILALGLYNSNKFLPFSKKETFLPQTELITQLQKLPNNSRVFSFSDGFIKTDFSSYFKYNDPNFYDPLYNKRYGEFISYGNLGKIISPLPRSDVEIINEKILDNEGNLRRNKIFDLTATRYFVAKESSNVTIIGEKIWGDKNWILTKTDFLPRIHTVSSVETIRSSKNILERIFNQSFDPRKTAIIEGGFATSLNAHHVELSNEIYEANTISLKTNSDGNTFLILADNYYPGWQAFIDNKETKIYRTNYTFRGIVVPKGTHSVVFTYSPTSVRVGMLISILSFVIFILYSVIPIRFEAKNKKK